MSGPVVRPKLNGPFLGEVEEWVERSEGKVWADIVHDWLAVGFAGNERITRRAVAAAKPRWRAGHRRTYRPWITEPGLWLQWDWGKGHRRRARTGPHGRRCCSGRGWRGHGSGSCCRPGTGRCQH